MVLNFLLSLPDLKLVHTKMKHLLPFALCIVMSAFSANAQQATDRVSYVNPMIGTEGMGHTFPGACAPFGIVQLSPDTDTIPHNVNGRYQGKVYEYCAGYQHTDNTIVGFSHTHLSGTGHSDLGDILIMPQTGDLKLNPGTADNPDGGYRQRFSHDTEHAEPGYYEVTLADNGVKVQLTATQRVGVHKYTFPEGSTEQRIILDLLHGIYNYDGKVLWSTLRVENDTLLTGYRITDGWARSNYTYFAISFSKPIRTYGYQDMKREKYNGFWGKFDKYHNFPDIAGRSVVAYFNFNDQPSRRRREVPMGTPGELVVKVALSGVSTEGALKNLQAEASGKSFDDIRTQTRADWERELSVIDCTGTDDQKAMLYTSLYHTMINPSIYMDVDRRYRGLDGNIHVAEDFNNYTVFSIWDTYRAEHPLLGLLKPSRNTDMVKSMIKHQQQNAVGMLPVWSLMGNEGWCMTGYHAVTVLADAIVKGADIDVSEALGAMTATANNRFFPSVFDYIRLGYAPYDNDGTAASNTLEYAFDDWTIYAAARFAGNDRVAARFMSRAQNYRNTFDSKIGFASPRYRNGEFKKDLDPYQTYGEGFIEGNSWNFSFHVPHDVFGLMRCMGGEDAFLEKLNNLFVMDLPEKYYADNEDITSECLIGGYVHGNEPSHHVPYLYAWTSTPWKTQEWLRTIMNKMYRNDIRGLGGNDDCGQMSAWYIFSALGFYPVCPGSDQYVMGAPYLPYLKVTLENGKTIEVKAPKVSDKNRYVQKVRINGEPYSKLFVTHKQLTDGCVIEFDMGSKPNKKRGLNASDKPYSLSGPSSNSVYSKRTLTPKDEAWDKHLKDIFFVDANPESQGSQIYHAIISDPDEYIRSVAREVMQCLYFAPTDSIPMLHRLDYIIRHDDGISAKGGGNGYVNIFYSTDHVERSFANQDTARVDFETRGVLLHELTHAFQLEPQGIGPYGGPNKAVWEMVEGTADAVRVACGGFHGEKDRPKGGSYHNGYRYIGYFFNWVRETKDKNFIKKMNHTCLTVVPWSWDGAVQAVLGEGYTIDSLWHEYQVAIGDIKE